MKLKQQVVSLEIAKKLKDLGVKQESLFYWGEQKGIWFPKQYSEESVKYGITSNLISSFTVAELGEMLGKTSYSNFIDACRKVLQRPDIDGFDLQKFITNPDLVAKILIYLLENNLLTNPHHSEV